MRNEFEIQTDLTEILDAGYDDEAARLARKAAIKELRAELQWVLTEGAAGCPNCEHHPIGIHQPNFYEVGCAQVTCRNRRARGHTVGEAVHNWNEAQYFKGNVT